MEEKLRNSPTLHAKDVKPFVLEIFGGKVCIAQYLKPFVAKKFRCFQPQILRYHPLCDDFGPMNMLSVTQFIEALDQEIESYSQCKIVYLVEPGRRALTNAAFLLGAYMILKLEKSSEEVAEAFAWLNDTLVEPYRDATYSEPDFHLTLQDCWRGLERSRKIGWVQIPSSPGMWGQIDIAEYDHYDNPLNGDLHSVVPDKFVAFRGPKQLMEKNYRDDAHGNRFFNPSYYVDVFKELGVTTVIRLNEPEYDRDSFIASGIRHFDLEFEDCTSPPPDVVQTFFRIVDASLADGGVVAIHCKAGLGRTGTLIALHMMRTYGFTAREAMGWLRIMRPGSIIGEQQHFLCAVERASPLRPPPPAVGPAYTAAAAAAGGGGVILPQLRAAPSVPPKPPPRAHAQQADAADAVSERSTGGGDGTDFAAAGIASNAPDGPLPLLPGTIQRAASSPSPPRQARGYTNNSRGGGGGGGGACGAAAALAAQVAAGMERRSAARSRSSLSGSSGGSGGAARGMRCLISLAATNRHAVAAATPFAAAAAIE